MNLIDTDPYKGYPLAKLELINDIFFILETDI